MQPLATAADMAARNIRALLGEGEYVARVDLEAGYRA